MKNQSGFATMILLATMPFLIGAGLLLFSLAGIIQMNTHLNSDCRKEQIRTQSEVRDLLTRLLALNARAYALRTEFIAAQIAVVAAVASPPPVLAAAKARLEAVRFRRQVLDFTQKGLIAAANVLLAKSTVRTHYQLEKNMRSSGARLLLDWQMGSLPPRPTTLSVEPEFPDVAPPYRTKERFTDRQALEQKWHYEIHVVPPLNRFLRGSARFEKICSTTLQKENQEWIVVTKEDKSSSKPSWF